MSTAGLDGATSAKEEQSRVTLRAAMIPLFERLEIESQANCNRSCWFCPRTYDRSGKYLNQNGKPVLSRMPTVKIVAILDEAAGMGFRGEVAFHYYSEPLLDERNPMLAGEAKQRGMQPYLHTNGDVLKLKPDLCDEIQGVYQRVAVGLYDFQTDDEIEEAKSYWRRRLDRVDLSFSYIPLSRSGGARSIGVPRALAPSDARMAVPDFTYLNAPCHRPLLRMIIQYDGEMGNCCEDTHGAFGLGNIYRNTLKELWYSERRVKVVVNLVNGRRELFELSRICPMAPTGKSPLGDKINMEPRRLREVPVFRPGVA